MSLLVILLLAGFVFGAFAIPFAAASGIPGWFVVVTIVAGQVARTMSMQVLGVAASNRMAERAARKGKPFPPPSVEKALEIAESRGVPTAGFLAPWITGTMAGVVVALAPKEERRAYFPWVTLGIISKVTVYTTFWVIAISIGANLAQEYIDWRPGDGLFSG